MENQSSNPKIISEFKKRKTKQLIAIIPLVLAFIPILFLRKVGTEILFGISANIILPVCFGIIFIMFIFALFNWRCPSCNKYLGKKMSPQFCNHCGVKLQD